MKTKTEETKQIFYTLYKQGEKIATFCGYNDLAKYIAKNQVKLFELGNIYQIKELEV